MDYIEKYVKAYILSAIHIDGRKEAPFWLEEISIMMLAFNCTAKTR